MLSLGKDLKGQIFNFRVWGLSMIAFFPLWNIEIGAGAGLAVDDDLMQARDLCYGW